MHDPFLPSTWVLHARNNLPKLVSLPTYLSETVSCSSGWSSNSYIVKALSSSFSCFCLPSPRNTELEVSALLCQASKYEFKEIRAHVVMLACMTDIITTTCPFPQTHITMDFSHWIWKLSFYLSCYLQITNAITHIHVGTCAYIHMHAHLQHTLILSMDLESSSLSTWLYHLLVSLAVSTSLPHSVHYLFQFLTLLSLSSTL